MLVQASLLRTLINRFISTDRAPTPAFMRAFLLDFIIVQAKSSYMGGGKETHGHALYRATEFRHRIVYFGIV